MPRSRRVLPVLCPVHVTNRGNDRRSLFRDPEEFRDFMRLLKDGLRQFPVTLDGYSVMPNHFHLIIRQSEPGAISAYMHRATTLKAMQYREVSGTVGQGHVFQRRYWSDPATTGTHQYSQLRYVEANAKRAGLVERAEDWEFGSLWERARRRRRLLAGSEVVVPPGWIEIVNAVQSEEDLQMHRRRSKTGRPGRRGGAVPGPGPSRQ